MSENASRIVDRDPKFKVVVTDIETLNEFRRWLEQVELTLRFTFRAQAK